MKIKKVVYTASGRDFIFANFAEKSFTTPTPANASCRRIMLFARGSVKLRGIEYEFVKARTEVFMASGTERQKIARLRRIEDEYCRKLADKPSLKLEMKRRIAETLLDMSISRERSFATCRARFIAIAKLGFTNIEQKAHYHLIYARAALERGHHQIADHLANKMIFELRRSLRRRRSLLGRELLGHFEQLARKRRA